MRILMVGNFGFGWDGSQCDEEHIAKALEDLGHEVIRLQREEHWNFKCPIDIDFALAAQWDGYPEEFKLNILGALDIPLIYWAFDYQADGQEWHERLVKEADLYLSKRIADSKYPNWQWLSQDFAPEFLNPVPRKVIATRGTNRPPNYQEPVYNDIEKDIDVLFTGSYLDWAKERNETIRAVHAKFNLVIHSVNAWPEEWNLDVRPPVMDDGLPQLYARAKVILSIDHTLEAGYWSDRSAQIIACGRRPLFRYVPLSEARFGDRVDYFYSIEDCLRKIENWDERPTNADGLYVQDRVKDLLTIVKGVL